MQQFEITHEEKLFILKRRELSEKRKSRGSVVKKVTKEQPKDAITGTNRPAEWSSHCKPCQVHNGRMTQEHPLYWFEEKIFQKISNLQHKEQHGLIAKLLKVPVQNVFRDRQYHGLIHLDALWDQQLIPLKYKIKYEAYKTEHGIGDDNVHPEHKKLKPDYTHPIPVKKRPWDAEKYGTCDETEEFVPGKKYIYNYDKEVGYSYKK